MRNRLVRGEVITCISLAFDPLFLGLLGVAGPVSPKQRLLPSNGHGHQVVVHKAEDSCF